MKHCISASLSKFYVVSLFFTHYIAFMANCITEFALLDDTHLWKLLYNKHCSLSSGKHQTICSDKRSKNVKHKSERITGLIERPVRLKWMRSNIIKCCRHVSIPLLKFKCSVKERVCGDFLPSLPSVQSTIWQLLAFFQSLVLSFYRHID